MLAAVWSSVHRSETLDIWACLAFAHREHLETVVFGSPLKKNGQKLAVSQGDDPLA